MIEEVDEVKANVLKYFKDCFVEQNYYRPTLGGLSFKQLSRSDSDFLVDPFTEDEVKAKIWRCDGDKSPGPDELNLRFIKMCWEFLKQDMFDFLNEFHENAFLPKVISTSFIALIPKRDNLQGLEDFCPISLIDNFYDIPPPLLTLFIKKILKKELFPIFATSVKFFVSIPS